MSPTALVLLVSTSSLVSYLTHLFELTLIIDDFQAVPLVSIDSMEQNNRWTDHTIPATQPAPDKTVPEPFGMHPMSLHPCSARKLIILYIDTVDTILERFADAGNFTPAEVVALLVS